jgi:tetratricopeptide (TPR) repeat protein
VLALASMPAVAYDRGAEWESGKQAFTAGDYRSALVYFETARDLGQSGPAVHYNIAVCQYQLGLYEDALATFGLIARDYPRMRGLAEYNMGLAENRLGNVRAARQHFVNAYQLSGDDENIRALAAGMLEETEEPAPSNWYGSLALRAGHDDNVALRESLNLPTGVTGESPMIDFFGNIRGAPSSFGGFMLDASTYIVAYPDASDFDQSEFRAGGLYVWRPDDWRVETSAHFVYGTLGGSGFEREVALGARATRYLGEEASLDFRLRYDDVDNTDADFAGLAGTRQRLDFRWRWYPVGSDFTLRLGYETNDRTDPGVSPTRLRAQLDYRYEFSDAWGVEVGAGIRNSDYDDLAVPRTDDLTTLYTALTRTLNKVWLVALQYQYSENDSSDPLFSYERNVITIGALRTF